MSEEMDSMLERAARQLSDLARRLDRRDEDETDAEGGSGVREPRRPISPNMSGGAALALPDEVS